MTNETRQRIESYQELLPNMKEKVAAALIMLVLALSVAVTATYAWITISRSPEVSSIATTMAANGNLEIALSNEKGSLPEEFDIDEGKTLTLDINGTNLQWGNLINLSDSSYYGIDKLALRPAKLNTGALRTNPLQGATYGTDGRVTELSSQYSFFKWDKATQSFVANNKYGVRAIASYTVATSDASNQEFIQKYNEVQTAYGKVADYYNRVFKKTIAGLGTGMNTFLQAKVNTTKYAPSGATSPLELKTSDIDSMLATYQALYDTMKLLLEAQASLANLQQYMFVKSSGQTTYAAITAEELYKNPEKYNSSRTVTAGSTDPLDAIMITGLKDFVIDYKKAETNIKKLTELRDKATNGEKVTSDDVTGPLYDLCQPNTAKIDGTPAKDLMNDKSKLVSMALGGDCLAQFDEGLLARFEQYGIEDTDRLPKSKKVSENATTISVKTSIMNVNITGHLCTGATGLSTAAADFSVDTSKFESADKNAQDTYGMAMDFWVRTNAEETLLTLEGALVADSATGEILSYDGVNRIWGSTGNTNLTTDSTTQGGGSCYIYYADNPADVARSLALVNQMKVAFVGADGTLLATASMDTEEGQYYAQNGRITVPLSIDAGSGMGLTYNYKDETEKEQTGLAISQLTMDNPQRITAIIYLDGTGLDNTMVLSSAEIQGQLNIQFGSSVNLKTSGDNRLLTAERKVTAELIGKTEFDFFADQDRTVTAKLTVDGTKPEKVTAFFVREITSTQGSREAEIEFTKTNDTGGTRTEWTGSYAINDPGTYWLRYVQLDGVDYALATPQKVVVKGFSITNVTWSHSNAHTVYSTENSHQEPISIQINATSSEQNPSTVTAVFERSDGNQISVPTRRDVTTGQWKGTASFTGSGNYTLSYVIVDGKYQAVPNDQQKKLELHLGLKATIKVDSKTGFDENNNANFESGETYSSKLYFTVTDDSNDPIEGVEGVMLTYTNGSVAGSHDVPAAWNDAGYYEAEIVMTMAGRYSFSSISMGGNTLRRATEAPVFTLISPDPPIYDETSQSTWHGEENIQFIPNSTTAILGPIKIKDTANDIQAVLYNDIAKQYFVVDLETSGSTVNGCIKTDGTDQWKIMLPTYQKTENGVTTTEIDGTWSLACLKLWNCYKNENFYTEEAPLVWLGTSEAAQRYKESITDFTAHENLDFSRLDTTVSNHVVVNMTTAKPALGSGTTAFMTEHPISEFGISVQLTDAHGRLIPATGNDSMSVTLTYQPNTAEDYGYKVTSDYPSDISLTTITLEKQGDNWVPNDASAALKLQYVGEYTVKLNINGKEYTHATNEVVPEKYTITSAGPTAANLGELKVTNTQTFGMEAATITGKFLGSYPLGITVTPTLTANGKPVNYVAISADEVTYSLRHTGNNEEYGGYTWQGSNDLTAVSGTLGTSGTGYASTGTQQLLAGTYTGSVSFKWGSTTKTVDLQPISVYSVQPEIKIDSVKPAGAVTFTTNTDTNSHYLVSNVKNKLETGYNSCGDYYAVVYMQYESYTTENNKGVNADHGEKNVSSEMFAHYIQPEITLKFANLEKDITITELGKTIGSTDTTATVAVGTVSQADASKRTVNEKVGETITGQIKEAAFLYNADTFTNLGITNIKEVTSTVGGVTYTRTLAEPVTISQTDHLDPWLNITQDVPGVSIKVEKEDGTALGAYSQVPGGTALRVTVTVTDAARYHAPGMETPANADRMQWQLVGSDENTAIYTCRMDFDDVTLTPTVKAYPRLTVISELNKSKVTAAVGNRSIDGTDLVKPGETVTVTANALTGWYQPRMNAAVSGWQQRSAGDYTAVYTFTMPEEDVTLQAPTVRQMRQVTWDNSAGVVDFQVTDTTENRTVANGGYVIPGHGLTITINAIGGVNPQLTAPADATELSGGSDFTKQYSYTMPDHDLTIAGTAKGYPAMSFTSNAVSVTKVLSNNLDVTPSRNEENGKVVFALGVKPGNTVQITLAAEPGFYAPRMKLPAGVTAWKKAPVENDQTATYTFVMPSVSGETLPLTVSATEAPQLTIENSGTSITASGKHYNGTAFSTTQSGIRVQPGTTVTVKVGVGNAATHLNPAVAKPAGVEDWNQRGTTYTFTMPGADVTLKGTADKYPTIEFGATNCTITVSGASGKLSSDAVVKPGEKLTVTLTLNDNCYDMKLVSDYAFVQNGNTYTYTVSSNDINKTITFSGSALKMPYITFDEITKCTVNLGNSNSANKLSTSYGQYLKPGETVTFYVLNSETSKWALLWDQKNPTLSVSGVDTSNLSIDAEDSLVVGKSGGWVKTNDYSKYRVYTLTVPQSFATGTITLTATGSNE